MSATAPEPFVPPEDIRALRPLQEGFRTMVDIANRLERRASRGSPSETSEADVAQFLRTLKGWRGPAGAILHKHVHERVPDMIRRLDAIEPIAEELNAAVGSGFSYAKQAGRLRSTLESVEDDLKELQRRLVPEPHELRDNVSVVPAPTAAPPPTATRDFYHVAIERTGGLPPITSLNLSLNEVQTRLADPFSVGRDTVLGGAHLSRAAISRVLVTKHSVDAETERSALLSARIDVAARNGTLVSHPPANPTDLDIAQRGQNVTDSLLHATNVTITREESSRRVFIVHGRSEGPREAVARLVEKLELDPIILRERTNEGLTLVEKLVRDGAVAFAIVVLTPDDMGSLAAEPSAQQPRPRQNVVLELGYFLGRLGRNRVCTLLVDDLELPSDWKGVLNIKYDGPGAWRLQLARELQVAVPAIDLNKLKEVG